MLEGLKTSKLENLGFWIYEQFVLISVVIFWVNWWQNMLIWQRTTCNYFSSLRSMHATWLLNFWTLSSTISWSHKDIILFGFFQPCDTVEIAEQLPASPLPPKSDVPAKFFSSNSSSSIKEVEVPDENVRQSPIGAETSDEELHANLVGDDQDYRNRYNLIDRPSGSLK